jgi:RNA polymerase sigma-70 factor, ECF subfamily
VSQSLASSPSSEASRLLAAWADGDEEALNQLIPLVYHELRSLARRQMRRERPGRSLQTSDLVNEAYLRLVKQDECKWKHRSQFLAVAATLMRRILIDRARRRRFQKRGGGAISLALEDAVLVSPTRPDQLVALDEALLILERQDSRKSRVVELRYFGGLSVPEIAVVLRVSPITIKRDWAMAKAWLYRELSHVARPKS